MSDSKINAVIEHYCKVRLMERMYDGTSQVTIKRRDSKAGGTTYLLVLGSETYRVSDKTLAVIRDGITELLEKTVTFE